MTTDVAAIRARLFNSDKLPQVAYTAKETAAALGVPEHRVWLLIRDGELPARHTGHRYLISGSIILAVYGKPHPEINDPRQVVDEGKAYYLKDLAALLGVSYGIAQRLAQNRRIEADRHLGKSPLFYGRTILKFLDGADEPMRSTESA